MDRRRAFTLVELLVVIAIIALLMSILMPALSRVRKQARATICKANLRHWGLIIKMYTEDNDGRFWREFNLGVAGSRFYFETLRPYFGNDFDFFCCPMASKVAENPGGGDMWRGGTFKAWGVAIGGSHGSGGIRGVEYGSYGKNGWIVDPWRDNPPLTPKKDFWKTTDVRGANNIPVLLDALQLSTPVQQTDSPPDYEGQTVGVDRIGLFCINRHEGTVNGLFMDSSVRKIGLKELWRLKWHRSYDLAYPAPIWPEWMKRFKDY